MTHAESRAFWKSVDWSKQDCVIAREIGYCNSAVGLARKALNQPKPKDYCRGRGFRPTARVLRMKCAALKMREGHATFQAIGEALGVTRQRAHQLCAG